MDGCSCNGVVVIETVNFNPAVDTLDGHIGDNLKKCYCNIRALINKVLMHNICCHLYYNVNVVFSP